MLHEVTRSETPTSDRIADWLGTKEIPIFSSRVYTHHRQALAAAEQARRKANLGELAIQEVMNKLALESPRATLGEPGLAGCLPGRSLAKTPNPGYSRKGEIFVGHVGHGSVGMVLGAVAINFC